MRANSTGAFGGNIAVNREAVAYGDSITRMAFLRKVYTLLSASMLLWMGTALFVVFNESLMASVLSFSGGGFMVFFLFIGAQFLLLRFMAKAGNTMSLVGLGMYGILMGVFTAPLIYIAMVRQAGLSIYNAAGDLAPVNIDMLASGGSVVTQAFVLTSAIFGGLTFYALTTKRDFSMMRGALMMLFWGMFAIAALGYFGIGGGFATSSLFSFAFVVLMGGFVLYDTQNIMKRFPSNMAALAAATLLLDFIIMFKYILMLFMRRD